VKKTILEKIFSAPVEILEKGVETGINIEHKIGEEKQVKAVKNFWKNLGPGLTTGAADDDPSGIATYSQIGASQGFSLLWLAPFSLPMMGVVQEMCARIGLATGVGLAANIKRHYSKKILYFCTALLLFANVFNIGADLGAMAKGVQLIVPWLPFAGLVLGFAIVSLFLQIFISYKTYAEYLKYLTFVLFGYVITAFFVEIDWSTVMLHTFVPTFSFSKAIIVLICAALGTTISPYLFFWQSSQEVEEQVLHGEKTEEARRMTTSEGDIKKMRIDVWSGAFVSNIVMFFIVAVCAATLYQAGITNIDSASDAAIALRPFAGNFAFMLFAIGIIGTGLLAIPVLAGSASYAISESFGWKTGLYRKLKQATSFYGVIIVAVVLGIFLNFIGLDPIKTLIYSAVLNGIISPVMIFLIIRLSSNGEIMGNFKNKKMGKTFGWLTFVLISVVSVGAVVSMFI
jgi:NRAMP (natural resistance-associated macrophage protein)-like metal ion transporter